ncbi:hyaluronan and proteoglycan link protein 1-like [Betta splendens]|uniref:Hyaluronan and proteoglycan link protein 1-like n=1 Tax=Betta splendens TaxID=158456 RepID=A0A6P7NEZ8_BETSP|nr:hyaluronan and proteoglycan link protein 1-like [Betta splendens]
MINLLHFTMISLALVADMFGPGASSPIQLLVNVIAEPGANATLPCRLLDRDAEEYMGVKIKWTRLVDDKEEDVLLSMGFHIKAYGSFEDRVFLETPDSADGSIVITNVSKEDAGRYQCEIINGVVDEIHEVLLEVQGVIGVVFPYSPPLGRYNLNFQEAEQACAEQGAVVASFEQMFSAWEEGLDWCNAGWLSDGTVQYPITKPRGPCGGSNNQPGIRSYGLRDKLVGRYDVFCYASLAEGELYWLEQPDRLSYDEAVQACVDDGARIAKVGHVYAAWKLRGFDRCDAGWLADGSVRYPISRPRKNCSPAEAAVRFVGFPSKDQKSYGVYCFRAGQPGAS